MSSKIRPIPWIESNCRGKIEGRLQAVGGEPDDSCIWEVSGWEGGQEEFQIFSPAANLGLSFRPAGSKTQFKLVANPEDFTRLSIRNQSDMIALFTDLGSAVKLVRDSDGDEMRLVLENYSAEGSNRRELFEAVEISRKKGELIGELVEISELMETCFEFFNEWGVAVDKKSESLFYSVREMKLSSS